MNQPRGKVRKIYNNGVLTLHEIDGVPQPLDPNDKPPFVFGFRPVPLIEWPIWAKALRAFSTPEDKGIGDVVARMIGEENSAKFSSWYFVTFGKQCGCKGRQAKWNKLYPLP